MSFFYLDDILIFSKRSEEHFIHIRKVFEKLREEKLLINLKKCCFVKKELVYLGFVVSVEGLKMDLEKVKAILEWPTPRSVIEVRSFHELDTFYKKFIRIFSSICGPLTETMRGDRKEFKWNVGADKSFNFLKWKVTEQPILALPNFNKVFQVDYDASGSTIGDVLSHEDIPIVYFTKNLNDVKKNIML